MGLMTLEEFREELTQKFGDRGVGNRRLDRWLNLAYFDLAGMIEFEGLKIRDTVETVASQYNYALPDNFLAFVAMADSDNKLRLRKKTDKDILLWDHEVEGTPEYWARQNTNYVLYPTPDDAYTLDFIYIREPELLSVSTDVTVFPAIWDFTLLLMAQHYGHLAFGEVGQANAILRKAQLNASTRTTDAAYSEPTPQAGLQVAWDESDLTVQE